MGESNERLVRRPAAVLTIGRLARSNGLSRSTLLYYDRIGLLQPSTRSAAGYRGYSAADAERLRRILQLRDTGVPLHEIADLLDRRGELAEVLTRQLDRLGEQIAELESRRRVVAAMLGVVPQGPTRLDRETWTAMFRAIGLDDAAMWRWHAAFEAQAPEAHHSFLESLGLSSEEIAAVRNHRRR
jgi:MerR family transcriptional regulator, thiopeptide resistance regulator